MSFVKTGDAQPIIKTHDDASQNDEKAKKALDEAKEAAKNINEDGNKIELLEKSGE